MTHKAENIYHLVIYRKSLLSLSYIIKKRFILLAPFSKKLQSICKVGLVIYLLDIY